MLAAAAPVRSILCCHKSDLEDGGSMSQGVACPHSSPVPLGLRRSPLETGGRAEGSRGGKGSGRCCREDIPGQISPLPDSHWCGDWEQGSTMDSAASSTVAGCLLPQCTLCGFLLCVFFFVCFPELLQTTQNFMSGLPRSRSCSVLWLHFPAWCQTSPFALLSPFFPLHFSSFPPLFSLVPVFSPALCCSLSP